MTLSAHAIGRYIQRGTRTIKDGLLEAAYADIWCRDSPPAVRRPKIIIPTTTGAYLGEIINVEDPGNPDGGLQRLPALRTWFEDDRMHEDLLASVRLLRDLPPENEHASRTMLAEANRQ